MRGSSRRRKPEAMTGVAIVIPLLNEAAGLPRLLRSLAALEPPPAEVLAVDGGSTDASVAIAEAAGLLVVRHETRGRRRRSTVACRKPRHRSSACCTPTPCYPTTRLP